MTNSNIFDRYFERLGLNSTTPSLELVAQVQERHLAAFCFNGLAPVLKQTLSLEIEDIVEKVVEQNLGGFCFEQNKLLQKALESLGFEMRILVGKVINNLDIDTPRTHRVCLLTWQGEQYLVDVGFGPNTPRVPIKLQEAVVSKQNRLSYRLIKNTQQEWQLEIVKADGYFSLYTFNLGPYTEADCMMGNFYSCQHPNAVFVNNLVLSKVLPDVTLSLRNNQYHRIGETETEVVDIMSAAQLQQIIKQDFDIELSDDDCADLARRFCRQ